jgi:hypothetical protein
MTRRTEHKLREIPIARYSYRHEAEFAAGFLEDAGIPFRLQVDDPSLGVPIGTMATIWVLGMDAARAREVLEVDARSGANPLEERSSRGAVTREVPRRPPASRFTPSVGRRAARMGARQRGVALLLAGVLVLLGETFLAGSGPSIVRAAMAVLAAGLGVVGIAGRAPGVLRRLLGALSGDAPQSSQ